MLSAIRRTLSLYTRASDRQAWLIGFSYSLIAEQCAKGWRILAV